MKSIIQINLNDTRGLKPLQENQYLGFLSAIILKIVLRSIFFRRKRDFDVLF